MKSKGRIEMDKRIIGNIVIYFIVTSFFLYIWWKQKILGDRIKSYRLCFGNWLIRNLNISKEGIKRSLQKGIDIVESIITALILVLVIQHFYIGNFKVPTPSMVPAIEIGDRMLANMVVYRFFSPKKEDVIVFKEPVEEKLNYTKRLVALPGETIKIENGILTTNGEKNIHRKYSVLRNTTDIPKSLSEGEEWIVPKKGDYFMIVPSTNYKQLFVTTGLNPDTIQKAIMENAALSFMFMPNLEFYVNGEETGPVMDFLHDNKILNHLMTGETVELILEDDYYFVLGDNTNHSADSRIWGFVKQDRIKGKILFRFWPLNRIGFVK